MTKCRGCGVLADSALRSCPLCRRKFEASADTHVNEWYPQYETAPQNPETNESNVNAVKTILFTCIVICCVLMLINAFALNDRLWCHKVIIPIVYVAFTRTHTFCSHAHLGLKILFQTAAITGLLLAADIQSGFSGWSVNYAFPILIIAATHVMTVISAVNKKYFYGFIEFAAALLLLSLLPVHLYIYGAATVFWPAVLAAVHSVLTAAGLYIFAPKDFIIEIARRFHF